VISAADGQALQTAQQVMDAVRTAYQQEPSAMLIADASLNPLELIVVDGQSGRYDRVPVTGNGDGTFSFGAPIPVTGPPSPNAYPSPPGAVSQAASRGVSARDEQRIQAAVARGAILPRRVAFYRAQAAAGHDISWVDQLAAGLTPAVGTLAAAVSPEDADYERMFEARAPQEADGGSSEYGMLFGSVEEGQRRADESRAAVRKEVAALTDDELHERMFPGASRTAAAAPVVASAAGPAGQHGQGGAARKRYRVKAPYVTLRVPQGSNGVAAGAEPAQTSWRTIELRGGDLVPEDAHPDDVKRLMHQKNRLGPLIKPW
jgi:hypothetical protein